jgi:hypothetical protein
MEERHSFFEKKKQCWHGPLPDAASVAAQALFCFKKVPLQKKKPF